MINNEIKQDTEDKSIKAWCHQCKSKVIVVNAALNKKEIKKDSYRTFLKGECAICGRKVSSIVKNLDCQLSVHK